MILDSVPRLGLGRELMEKLIIAARDMRVREIVGHVLAANTPMIRFSESLGFDVLPGDEPDVRRLVLHL